MAGKLGAAASVGCEADNADVWGKKEIWAMAVDWGS